jgi:hypothetical protein
VSEDLTQKLVITRGKRETAQQRSLGNTTLHECTVQGRDKRRAGRTPHKSPMSFLGSFSQRHTTEPTHKEMPE